MITLIGWKLQNRKNRGKQENLRRGGGRKVMFKFKVFGINK